MPGEVDIANQVLGQIGARATIASFNENSNEARTIRTYYADTQDALLRAAPWNFCSRSDYLTLMKALPGTPENPGAGSTYWLPEYPPVPWLYSYFLPANCVKFRAISPQTGMLGVTGTPIFSVQMPMSAAGLAGGQTARFKVYTDVAPDSGSQTTAIATNQSMAIGVWNERITNVALWDPSFKQAFIDSLAARVAIPITGDRAMATMVKGWAQGAVGTINVARANDGNEGMTIDDHIPDWLRVRGYAGDWSSAASNGYWDTPSFLMV